ncbi:MAG: hypothetical protein LBI20_01115 [Holosporales bacterium]|nr:hypothetical protein [Holosporales bacterium]
MIHSLMDRIGPAADQKANIAYARGCLVILYLAAELAAKRNVYPKYTARVYCLADPILSRAEDIVRHLPSIFILIGLARGSTSPKLVSVRLPGFLIEIHKELPRTISEVLVRARLIVLALNIIFNSTAAFNPDLRAKVNNLVECEETIRSIIPELEKGGPDIGKYNAILEKTISEAAQLATYLQTYASHPLFHGGQEYGYNIFNLSHGERYPEISDSSFIIGIMKFLMK